MACISYKPSSNLNILPAKKVTSLPIDVTILVPSTNYSKKIPEYEFNRRINVASRFMANAFGGDTTISAKGGYVSSAGKLISEKVAEVNASMTHKQFEDNKHKLEKFIEAMQKLWNQETLAYKVENDLKIYPKFGTTSSITNAKARKMLREIM